MAIEHDGCYACKHFAKYSNITTTTSDMPCYDCKLAHRQEKLKDLYEPMTNADKIRNMTDEELANTIFWSICVCAGNPDYIKSSQGYLKWLQSEVKESEEE